MRSFFASIFLGWMLFATHVGFAQDSVFKHTETLMGCRFDFTVVAKNSEGANGYFNQAIAEIRRIEQLISSWDPASQTSMINRHAGTEPVAVDPELYSLIDRAISISRLTDGAFDITYASMDRIWKFDGSMMVMPPADKVSASVVLVRFEKIELDLAEHSVFLPNRGMKIGFGAIGKGYAADRAKSLLKAAGCAAGIINASGDLSAWGKQPDGRSWQVAIVNPQNKEEVFALLPVEDKAVVTSGDYEKFVQFDGKRYAHIIDPRTGYPATGIVSVSVFAPSAELADALATSVFVMGVDVGLDRINQLPGVECIIVDEHGGIFTSDNIQIDQL